MRSLWWQQSRLNRASSPISPTWAAVVKDGNWESSVYLSMDTRFRIFFRQKKWKWQIKIFAHVQFFAIWRFGICRSSDSSGGTTPVCMRAWVLFGPGVEQGPKPPWKSWRFFGESLWKLWKLEKVDGGFTLSIHGNKSAKISRICVHVYVYIQFFFQPLRLSSRGEPCIAAWILLHTGGAIRFGWKCIYIHI